MSEAKSSLDPIPTGHVPFAIRLESGKRRSHLFEASAEYSRIMRLDQRIFRKFTRKLQRVSHGIMPFTGLAPRRNLIDVGHPDEDEAAHSEMISPTSRPTPPAGNQHPSQPCLRLLRTLHARESHSPSLSWCCIHERACSCSSWARNVFFVSERGTYVSRATLRILYVGCRISMPGV